MSAKNDRRQRHGDVDSGRRAMLAGTVATALIATGSSDAATKSCSIDPYEQVRQDARKLAQSMQAIHGGPWSMHINHDLGAVSVTVDLVRREQ